MKHLDVSRLPFVTLSALSALLLAGCGSDPTPAEHEHDDEAVGASEDALSAAQCNYFAVNGKVQICHRTGSAKNPYSVLKISEQACINAHAMHAGDYIAVNDPTCQGGGCLPEGAPCDATLPCCEGFSCNAGTCTPNISNHCDPDPCQNGSTCVNDTVGYTCECIAGYVGTNCEIEINECDPDPCDNGVCLDGINSYTCECDPGWTGTNCDIDIDECESSPCNNGACQDQVNGYSCDCDPGWTGTNCDIDIDECESAPCVNGTCQDQVNGYSCACVPGWAGTNCDENLCLPGLPVSSDGQTYACACPIGLTGDACELPWDFTLNNPCIHGGSWDSEAGACACVDGYSGQFCELDSPIYSCAYSNPCDGNNDGAFFASDTRRDYYLSCHDGGQCTELQCASDQTWSQADQSCVTVTSCPCDQYPGWDSNIAITGGQGFQLTEADALAGNQNAYYAIYATGWDPVFLQGQLLLPDTGVTAVIAPIGNDTFSGCFSFSRPAQSYFAFGDLSPAEAALCYGDVTPAINHPDTTPLPDLPAPLGFVGAGLLGLAEIGRRIVRRRSK